MKHVLSRVRWRRGPRRAEARAPGMGVLGSTLGLVACLALTVPLLTPAAALAAAPAEAGTVRVLVVDPTGDGPGEASAVAILGSGPDVPVIAEARQVRGEAVLAEVRLAADETYLVRVTAGGVDYWARETGARLLAEPLTMQVFPTTTVATAVTIDNLDLILRRTEAELLIETLLTVSNTGTPARTILPSPASLELAWPEGSQAVQIEMLSVPDAPLVGPETAAPGRIGLPLVLRPGASRIRVTGRVPYDGRAEVPVGSDLAISRWSALATPPDLQLRGSGLAEAPGDPSDGFRRHQAPPLAAGETALLVVTGGSVAAVAETEETAGATGGPVEQQERAAARSGSGGLLWVAAFVVAALVYLAVRRRRR